MTTEQQPKRPWQRHRTRPLRREGIHLAPMPDAQIDIYPHQTVLTRRINGIWSSYPVDPSALAQALAGLPLQSGLLPPDTLGWGIANGEPFVVRYLPPHIRTLRVRVSAEVLACTFQLPPLVWAWRAGIMMLWAVNTMERPTETASLCRAPFPNSYPNGGICWGSVDRPANADTGITTFFGSEFSLHVDNEKSRRYPANVVTMWKTLDTEQPYPLDDLIETGHDLRWLLAGEPWNERSR